MENAEARELAALNANQKNLTKWADSHEVEDNKRFALISQKIDNLQSGQAKLMGIGIVLIPIATFLLNKMFGA